jgi:hypothetical protein
MDRGKIHFLYFFFSMQKYQRLLQGREPFHNQKFYLLHLQNKQMIYHPITSHDQISESEVVLIKFSTRQLQKDIDFTRVAAS